MTESTKMRIGVLALQGDFKEHEGALRRSFSGVEVFELRYPEQLVPESIDALVIPGGESTAVARLFDGRGAQIMSRIKVLALAGMPVYGTCMGAILLSTGIERRGADESQPRLGLIDITVTRNGYGPQRASFEQAVPIAALGEPDFNAVFIRAPVIERSGESVEVLAEIDGKAIMARAGNILVSTFHPEIADDDRVHAYFVAMVRAASGWQTGKLEGGPVIDIDVAGDRASTPALATP